MDFKLGDVIENVWCGEIFTVCEFICYMEYGNMLVYDVNHKCFRKVYIQYNEGFILNGWQCANTPRELLFKEK